MPLPPVPAPKSVDPLPPVPAPKSVDPLPPVPAPKSVDALPAVPAPKPEPVLKPTDQDQYPRRVSFVEEKHLAGPALTAPKPTPSKPYHEHLVETPIGSPNPADPVDCLNIAKVIHSIKQHRMASAVGTEPYVTGHNAVLVIGPTGVVTRLYMCVYIF